MNNPLLFIHRQCECIITNLQIKVNIKNKKNKNNFRPIIKERAHTHARIHARVHTRACTRARTHTRAGKFKNSYFSAPGGQGATVQQEGRDIRTTFLPLKHVYYKRRAASLTPAENPAFLPLKSIYYKRR